MSAFVATLLGLSPTALWPLNDSGSTAVDIVGGFNGTIGAGWSQDASVLANQGDGYNNSHSIPAAGGTVTSSNQILVANNAALNPASKFSIVGLYKFTGTSAAPNVNMLANSYPTSQPWNILNNGNHIHVQVNTGSIFLFSTATLVAGTLYLVVVTYDGTLGSNAIKIYLQGSLDNQGAAGSGITGYGNGLTFGQVYAQGNIYTSQFFQDWAQFSGVILTPTNVSDLWTAVSFVGPATQQFSAALTFAGISPKRKITHPLTAALTFVGNAPKRAIAKKITAGLTFAGAIKARANKVFAAALTFAGATNKRTTHAFAAALTFVGALQPQTRKAFAASLTFVGAQSRKLGLRFNAGLTFVGITPKLNISHAIAAALSFAGVLQRRTTHSFSAALTFVGALAASAHYSKVLTAALSFSGAIQRRTSTRLSAALTFAGAQKRSITHKLTAALTFVGSIQTGSHLSRVFSASLSFASSQNVRVTHAFTASLTFAGSLGRSIAARFHAALTFIGALSQHQGAIAVVFHATLAFSGNVNRGIAVFFHAALRFVGQLRFPHPTPKEIVIVNVMIETENTIVMPILQRNT